MKNIILSLSTLLILLLSCNCRDSRKDVSLSKTTNNTKKIDSSIILQELDKYNTENMCIYKTPTYQRLSNDLIIHTDIKNRMDIVDLFTLKNNKLDSINLIKTDSTIIINEFFFIHGHYDFVPSYIINDTSIQIKTIEVSIVELTYYAEKKELITIDVTIAYPAEIVTKLKIKKQDRNKTVYYNNRKLIPFTSKP